MWLGRLKRRPRPFQIRAARSLRAICVHCRKKTNSIAPLCPVHDIHNAGAAEAVEADQGKAKVCKVEWL